MTSGSSAALLTGRSALVTGAASGIGAALTRRLRADGAAVLAVDRDEAGLKVLAEEIPGVQPVACDLSDLDAVDALPAGVDVLVNNAGLQHVAPSTSRASPHPDQACSPAGLPGGTVRELDAADVFERSNVAGVEFTARSTGTHARPSPWSRLQPHS